MIFRSLYYIKNLSQGAACERFPKFTAAIGVFSELIDNEK
jgi:hypothetical protein